MKKRILILFLFGLQQLFGQDFHFSQFYASPLTLNPALTGRFNGSLRVGGIYRMQWSGLATSSFLYQTPSASIDGSFAEGKIGLGAVILNDQTNDKVFNTLEMGVSFSYKIKFEKFHISTGLQGWYKQNSLDVNKVEQVFQQQEPNLTPKIESFDFNAGVFSSYSLNDDQVLYGGLSAFHLLNPKDQNATTNTITNLPLKICGQLGGDFKLNEQWNIIPGVFYAQQAQASQINFGGTLAYYLNRDEDLKHTIFFIGMWSRFNELSPQSIIPKVGIEYKNIRATVSYDYNLKNFNQESSSSNRVVPNTFEMSLIFISAFSNRNDNSCYMFNPRF